MRAVSIVHAWRVIQSGSRPLKLIVRPRMRSLGIALVVVACLGWMVGANAVIGPRRLRPGEKPLVFDVRPIPRLGDLTSSQKRKVLWLISGVVLLGLLGLAMAQGAFHQ